MLVSFQGHKYGRQKSTETSFFELAEGRGGGGWGGGGGLLKGEFIN